MPEPTIHVTQCKTCGQPIYHVSDASTPDGMLWVHKHGRATANLPVVHQAAPK